MAKREAHIDVARGLGILLIVAGHNWIIIEQTKVSAIICETALACPHCSWWALLP